MSATTLLADRGAAATGSDFFRSSVFLAAEGTTHTLVVDAGTTRVCVPLIVRDVPGSARQDAISPYGYPGGRLDGPIGTPLDASAVDLRPTGLVSAFVRDRLVEPALVGGTARGVVVLHDPTRPRSLSKTFRRDLRRCSAAGYQAEVHAGAEARDEELAGFATAYHATMDQVGASDRYRFSPDYLRACLDAAGSWLVLVTGPHGGVAAGELVVTSDGLLHSYLAGTCTADRPWSPGKLATARAIDLADDLSLALNFGGGLSPGDGVERSKRSYGNATSTFVTHEFVGDLDAMTDLTGRGPRSPGFFPPYRAPVLESPEPADADGVRP